MHRNFARGRAAVVLGLLVALAVPGSAFASTTTVVVQGTISVSGVPAAIDFGSGGPGDVKAAPTYSVTPTTNNPTGYVLSVTMEDMTGAGTTISKMAHSFMSAQVACNSTCTGDLQTFTNIPIGGTLQLGKRSTSTTGESWTINDHLLLPNVPPGTYNGTFTINAVTQ